MNVSLKQGLVSIALKPGNTVSLQQVRKAIENDAFTPKGARVVVAGELRTVSGSLEFMVSGTNETYPVASTAHASWDKQIGKQALVTGLISAPSNQNGSGTLEITEASTASAVHRGP